MSDDRDIENMDELPPALRDAVELLRDAVPVRPEWRADTIARVSRVSPRARMWSMRPLTAIAAGLAMVMAGAAGGALFVARQRDERPAAAAPDASPANVVRFLLVQPAARRVSVVGDFNGWNPGAMPLRRLSDGRTWIVEMALPPGRYTYAFVVDGAIVADPTAARAAGDDFGVASSVVLVRGS